MTLGILVIDNHRYYLLFKNITDYYAYMNKVATIINTLEYDLSLKHNRMNTSKLRSLKIFLNQIFEAKLSHL